MRLWPSEAYGHPWWQNLAIKKIKSSRMFLFGKYRGITAMPTVASAARGAPPSAEGASTRDPFRPGRPENSLIDLSATSRRPSEKCTFWKVLFFDARCLKRCTFQKVHFSDLRYSKKCTFQKVHFSNLFSFFFARPAAQSF